MAVLKNEFDFAMARWRTTFEKLRVALNKDDFTAAKILAKQTGEALQTAADTQLAMTEKLSERVRSQGRDREKRSRRSPLTMTREIYSIVCHVQEALIAMNEEDEILREIMRTGPRVDMIGEHFRLLRHYASKLHLLLDEFESETFREQLKEETREAADKVQSP